MPNWCETVLEFTVPSEREAVDLINRFDNPDELLEIELGTHYLRKLFILIYTGHVRVATNLYALEPLRRLSIYGGAHIDLNKPIDDEASFIWNMVALKPYLEDDTIKMLREFFEKRGWDCEFDFEPDFMRENWDFGCKLLEDMGYDYFNDYFNNKDRSLGGWFKEKPPELKSYGTENDNSPYHGMEAWDRPRIQHIIGGYNNSVGLGGVTDGFINNVEQYGTKWPGFQFDWKIKELDTGQWLVRIEFSTAWSPFDASYLQIINRYLGVYPNRFYSEMGMGYCGCDIYQDPDLGYLSTTDQISGQIVNEGLDDEDWEVTGPVWLIKKMEGRYGG